VHLVPERGTRHGAAQRFSHDAPGCVVFVVSSDGPVTVYVGGETVASIDMRNSAATAAPVAR
jgi:DNA integrity scanning protein DisA with diadenylate cyclase activity